MRIFLSIDRLALALTSNPDLSPYPESYIKEEGAESVIEGMLEVPSALYDLLDPTGVTIDDTGLYAPNIEALVEAETILDHACCDEAGIVFDDDQDDATANHTIIQIALALLRSEPEMVA
jgi:hypothetical protein